MTYGSAAILVATPGRFWRDKRGHEVDFVWVRRGRVPLAIECIWSADQFTPESVQAFARQYPRSELMVVAQDVDRAYRRVWGEADVAFVNLAGLIRRLTS